MADRSEPTECLTVFEAKGRIKWFDPQRGFGLIEPDDDVLDDVLIHVTCLRRAGLQSAMRGAAVHFQAIERPKGLQVLRVISIDESMAEPEGDWTRAVCKWFNRERGFGFLTLDDGGPDIFLHIGLLRAAGFAELRTDQPVDVRCAKTDHGYAATALRPATKF